MTAQPGDAEQAGGLTDDCDCGPGEHTLACDARFGTRVRILAARAAGPADDTAERALRDAADALEGGLGIEGTPRDLYEFRLWLRARAREVRAAADTAHPADSFNRTDPIDEGEL